VAEQPDPAGPTPRNTNEAIVNPQLSDLIERYPALAPCTDDIDAVFRMMCDCYRNGGKVLICGNGGSAADAEHWAGELLKGFLTRRPVTGPACANLPPDLAPYLQGSLPTIPLTGFLSLGTAFANDVSSLYIFSQLVWGLGRPGDILIGISTSGNSRNILHALETARCRGLRRIGLTGVSGGEMTGQTDICIQVPASRVHEIQELHLPVYHCLSNMLEQEFFPETE